MANHLVAKYGGKGAGDLFAAMPPFEMVKALMVRTVQRRHRIKTVRKVMFIDVSKAHLYALVGEEIHAYVDLPPECSKPGVCGKLVYWLYGMRPASNGWQQEYTRRLESLGFKAGEGSPCCFYREKDDVACVVHGDDFTFEDPPGSLKQIAEAMKQFWLIKVRATLGPEPSDDKEVSILNRVVRWTEDCLLYEADPRHVEKLLRDMGMEECKTLTVPGIKAATGSVALELPEELQEEIAYIESKMEQPLPKDLRKLLGSVNRSGKKQAEIESADYAKAEEQHDFGKMATPGGDKLMDRDAIRDYRSATARCNYLAADRPEIAFATKELCRAMPAPTEADVLAVKRMCKFLKGMPRLVQRIPFSEDPPSVVHTYVDSDWAGCRRTRKSTSGGVIYFGGSMVRGWSTTQAVIALSSGEAEYYAALKGASTSLGFQSMLRDLGMEASIQLHTDSSAALGIINRAGLGKLRHLEVGYLWLQAAVKAKKLRVRKVLGTENPADLLTKHLSAADMHKHLTHMGFAPETGRSTAVPQV